MEGNKVNKKQYCFFIWGGEKGFFPQKIFKIFRGGFFLKKKKKKNQ